MLKYKDMVKKGERCLITIPDKYGIIFNIRGTYFY